MELYQDTVIEKSIRINKNRSTKKEQKENREKREKNSLRCEKKIHEIVIYYRNDKEIFIYTFLLVLQRPFNLTYGY